MSKNEQIDVTIWNGRRKMQTTTVSGSPENIAKIRKDTEEGVVFDVAGSNIKIGYFEKASRFLNLFRD